MCTNSCQRKQTTVSNANSCHGNKYTDWCNNETFGFNIYA